VRWPQRPAPSSHRLAGQLPQTWRHTARGAARWVTLTQHWAGWQASRHAESGAHSLYLNCRQKLVPAIRLVQKLGEQLQRGCKTVAQRWRVCLTGALAGPLADGKATRVSRHVLGRQMRLKRRLRNIKRRRRARCCPGVGRCTPILTFACVLRSAMSERGRACKKSAAGCR
jgi:hypothetical protein